MARSAVNSPMVVQWAINGTSTFRPRFVLFVRLTKEPAFLRTPSFLLVWRRKANEYGFKYRNQKPKNFSMNVVPG